jgi:hypothetical protein
MGTAAVTTGVTATATALGVEKSAYIGDRKYFKPFPPCTDTAQAGQEHWLRELPGLDFTHDGREVR